MISILPLGIVMISLMLPSPWIVSVTGIFGYVDRVVAIPLIIFAMKRKGCSLIGDLSRKWDPKGTIYNLEEKVSISDALKLENEQLCSLLEFKEIMISVGQDCCRSYFSLPSTWENELTLIRGSLAMWQTLCWLFNGGLLGVVTTPLPVSLVYWTNEKNDSSLRLRFRQNWFCLRNIVTLTLKSQLLSSTS